MAKNYYTGEGEIIDAGAFIGASAYAFAAGLNDNINISTDKKNNRIHSYDFFKAMDDYTVDYIQNNLYCKRDNQGNIKCISFKVEKGYDYKEVFDFQTQKYSSYINTYSGDVCQYKWEDSPIELLMIDVAKTLKINSHFIKYFFPALVPGKSILIQQDFHHPWHPYIHVTMEYLKDYFEIVASGVNASRVYLYKDNIPQEKIMKSIDYDFSHEEKSNLLRSMINSSSEKERLLLNATLAVNFMQDCNFDLCLDELKSMKSKYGDQIENKNWYIKIKENCMKNL